MSLTLRCYTSSDGGEDEGDIVLDAGARRACLALLSELSATLHRSDARKQALKVADKEAAELRRQESRKRARVAQSSSALLTSMPAEALVGVLSYLEARDLSSVARTQIARPSEGAAAGESAAGIMGEAVALAFAAKFGAAKIMPVTSPPWHAICIVEDASRVVADWKLASPANSVLDSYALRGIIGYGNDDNDSDSDDGEDSGGGKDYGPEKNIEVHLANLVERICLGETNRSIDFESEAVSQVLDESGIRARYCSRLTMLAAFCIIGEGGMATKVAKVMNSFSPPGFGAENLYLCKCFVMSGNARVFLEACKTEKPDPQFERTTVPWLHTCTFYIQYSLIPIGTSRDMCELLFQQVIQSGLLEYCIETLSSSAPSPLPPSHSMSSSSSSSSSTSSSLISEEMAMQRAVDFIKVFRSVETYDDSRLENINTLDAKLYQLMTSTPNFAKFVVTNFKKYGQNLMLKMRSRECGTKLDAKFAIKNWLHLFQDDFDYPRPLFSAQLVEAGLVEVLDELMPKQSESKIFNEKDIAQIFERLNKNLLSPAARCYVAM